MLSPVTVKSQGARAGSEPKTTGSEHHQQTALALKTLPPALHPSAMALVQILDDRRLPDKLSAVVVDSLDASTRKGFLDKLGQIKSAQLELLASNWKASDRIQDGQATFRDLIRRWRDRFNEADGKAIDAIEASLPSSARANSSDWGKILVAINRIEFVIDGSAASVLTVDQAQAEIRAFADSLPASGEPKGMCAVACLGLCKTMARLPADKDASWGIYFPVLLAKILESDDLVGLKSLLASSAETLKQACG